MKQIFSRNFFLLLAYIALNFCMLPYFRLVVDFLRKQGLLSFSILMLTILAIMICFYNLYKNFNKQILYVLPLLCFAYSWGFDFAVTIEEKFHFFQYGLMSLLAYRYFKVFELRKHLLFFVCLLLCSFIGYLDEVIQYYLPNRFFDWRDVFLNFYAALLALIIIFSCSKKTNF